VRRVLLLQPAKSKGPRTGCEPSHHPELRWLAAGKPADSLVLLGAWGCV